MTLSSTSTRPFAVVTGASCGIGLELAKQFATNGYDLLIVAEDGGIDGAAGTIRGLGAEVQAVQQDLATSEGVDATWDAIKATGRPVDAVALNAGIGVGGPFVETDLKKELELIALNVTSTVHLAKHVVRDMHARNRGRILITGSVVSEMPGPFQAIYAASKAFVFSFGMALRNELKETNVSVTVLQPGATETNFFHRAGLDDTKVGASKKDDAADVARQGFEALMNGDENVVAASLKTKMLGVLENILPESTKAELHRGMSEPGSANKKAS